MILKFKKMHSNAIAPKYATPGAACFDLHAATVEGMTNIGANVQTGYPITCSTGLSFEIPEGFVMLVYSRSGHGFKHQVRLSNAVGVVDSDYRGEVMVQLISDARDEDLGYVPFFVRPGDRIAQAMIVPIFDLEMEEVDELSTTERGTGGFGSTGA
jgi:dUTP pyrophosphatase